MNFVITAARTCFPLGAEISLFAVHFRRFRAAAIIPILCGVFLSASLAAAQPPVRIAIVIDDLGISLQDGRRALRLPGPVATAILPHQAHSLTLAVESRGSGHEALLHRP